MMLYIYKLRPTQLNGRLVRDAQAMHAALCEMAGCSRAEGNILWSLDEEHWYLKVQSDVPLEVRDGLDLIATLDLERQKIQYRDGDRIHFQLTTTAYKKRAGKQVYCSNPDEVAQNIVRRLDRAGLSVEAINIVRKRSIGFHHSRANGGYGGITVWEADVYGTIEDSSLFWNTWHHGMGQHKAYGSGLLILKAKRAKDCNVLSLRGRIALGNG